MCRGSDATRSEISISINRNGRPVSHTAGSQATSHSKSVQQQVYLDSQESLPGLRKRKASIVQDPISQLISVKRVSAPGPVLLAMSTAPA